MSHPKVPYDKSISIPRGAIIQGSTSPPASGVPPNLAFLEADGLREAAKRIVDAMEARGIPLSAGRCGSA